MKPILINLDLKTNSYEEIELKQGCQDTLIATITDGGEVCDLTGQVISVEMLKADSTFIIQSNYITVSGNKVTVILNKDLTRVSGKAKLQFKMVKNDIVSGSWSVDCWVRKGAIDGNIGQSGNIVTIKEELDKSIVEAKVENDKTQDLIENGGAATKGQVAELSSQMEDIKNEEIKYELSTMENFKMDIKVNAKRPLKIDTYDGGNEAMHPKVLYFSEKYNGFKYWMVYTPYTGYNEAIENPCIAVSNDGINWTKPDGLTNPIANISDVLKEYNSDPHLVFNSSNNNIEVWYRHNIRATNTEVIKRKVSTDGINWSEEQILFSKSEQGRALISPSVIFSSSGKYRVWVSTQKGLPSERVISYYETNEVGKEWTLINQIDINNKSYYPSHLDVAINDGKVELFIQFINKKTNSLDHIVYCNSQDNIMFSDPKVVLTRGGEASWDGGRMYRPSVTYINGVAWLYYCATSLGGKWATGLIKLNKLLDDISTTQRINVDINTPPRFLNEGLNITTIQAHKASNYPTGQSGLLVSFRPEDGYEALSYEIYKINNSTRQFIRYAKDNISWSNFELLSLKENCSFILEQGVIIDNNYINKVVRNDNIVVLNLSVVNVTITNSGTPIAYIKGAVGIPELGFTTTGIGLKSDETREVVMINVASNGQVKAYSMSKLTSTYTSLRISSSYIAHSLI